MSLFALAVNLALLAVSSWAMYDAYKNGERMWFVSFVVVSCVLLAIFVAEVIA